MKSVNKDAQCLMTCGPRSNPSGTSLSHLTCGTGLWGTCKFLGCREPLLANSNVTGATGASGLVQKAKWNIDANFSTIFSIEYSELSSECYCWTRNRYGNCW